MIGDIPIYVALDSADSWAHPELFQFDENHMPSRVAGCPPDAFSADGQLWGNPLYNWEYHRQTDFTWWKKRIAHCMKLYDVVGGVVAEGLIRYISNFYERRRRKVPGWRGPRRWGLHSIRWSCRPIIAEDLGYLTDSVVQLVQDSGYPGMKVIEFAFDSREAGDYILTIMTDTAWSIREPMTIRH